MIVIIMIRSILHFFLIIVICKHQNSHFSIICNAQYNAETLLNNGQGSVNQALSSSVGINNETYTYDVKFPASREYYIGLIINPCGVNGTNFAYYDSLGFDCCMHRFGEGEYGYLKPEALPFYSDEHLLGSRIPNNRQLARHDEILSNIDLVDENGDELPYSASRRADDEEFIDETCRDVRDPYLHCTSWLIGSKRSKLVAPCWDNNQTVDSTLDCFTPEGQKMSTCMQIGFTQTAFIHVCGVVVGSQEEEEEEEDDSCGTFIEIHRQNGSPYDAEDEVLSETKLTTHFTNGMVTTTIPLTYKSNPSRILCAYAETKPRIGSLVLINANARQCCCPAKYSTTERLGSFFCPPKAGTKGGPFAASLSSLTELLENDNTMNQYPFCHLTEKTEDVLMCSYQSVNFTEFRYDSDGIGSERGRFFTYPCNPVTQEEWTGGMYASDDLSGIYESVCSYNGPFKSCGLMPQNGECDSKDQPWSFQGEVGKLISIPITPYGTYHVSFNDGRTSYEFYQHEFDLLKTDSNYELWWVQRRGKIRSVRRKKSFRVIHPNCTFDSVNDQYFPFTEIGQNGTLIDQLSKL